MKSCLTLLIFFLCFYFNLFSQVPFWPLDASQCIETGCPPDGPYFQNTSSAIQDTVIQGKYCTTILGTFIYPGPLGEGVHYVHQDLSKVYFYQPSNGEFQLLYDFSLEPGDSYEVIVDDEMFLADTVKVTIDEKWSSVMNGVDVTKMSVELSAKNEAWTYPEVGIVEGLGGVYGNVLLFFNPFVFTNCYEYTIDYYTPQTGSIPINLPSDGIGCMETNLNDTEEQAKYLSLSPNPATNVHDVRISYEIPSASKGSVIITDAVGRKIKTLPLENSVGEIMLPSLMPGLYFVTLVIDGHLVETERLVIH